MTNIAHQLGYFETVTGPRFSGRRCNPACRAGDAGAGLGGWPRTSGSCGQRTVHVGLVPANGAYARDDDRGFAACRPSATVLDNGAVVIVQETSNTPAVTINATVHAGSVHDPDDLSGVANCCRACSIAGRRRRSAEDIAEALDDRGISLRMRRSRHAMSLRCTCLSEDFDEVLAIVADIARRPSFPDDEIAKRKARVHHGHPAGRGQPGGARHRSADGAALPRGHPYGRPAKGTVDERRAHHAATISRAFHAERFARRLTLAIVGDVGRRCTRSTGGGARARRLAGRSGEARSPAATRPTGRRQQRVDPDDEQVAGGHRLRLHHHRRRDPAYYATG